MTNPRRVQKVVLSCETCAGPFETYQSKIDAARAAGVRGPRFCSAACFAAIRTGPKCSKCGGVNSRGKRYRVCQACLDSSPGALAVERARRRQAECPDGLRWCTVCDEFLPPGQFPALIVTKGLHICSACRSRQASSRHLARDFGLDDAQYEALLKRQEGVCAICHRPPKKIRLHIDHDHKTGVIRGLLCSWCNHKLLSGARDSIEVLRNAVAYMEAPPAIAVLGETTVPKKRRKRSTSTPTP